MAQGLYLLNNEKLIDDACSRLGHVVTLLHFRALGSGVVAYCSSGTKIAVLVMGPWFLAVLGPIRPRGNSLFIGCISVG
jgi:hypothetical protein